MTVIYCQETALICDNTIEIALPLSINVLCDGLEKAKTRATLKTTGRHLNPIGPLSHK